MSTAGGRASTRSVRLRTSERPCKQKKQRQQSVYTQHNRKKVGETHIRPNKQRRLHERPRREVHLRLVVCQPAVPAAVRPCVSVSLLAAVRGRELTFRAAAKGGV